MYEPLQFLKILNDFGWFKNSMTYSTTLQNNLPNFVVASQNFAIFNILCEELSPYF